MKTSKQLTRNHLESGQVAVLMAFLMIGLIAFLGLAIDGGGLFLLWRNEQNAVDAAVLAASYARCTGNVRELTVDELHAKVVNAGLDSAAVNGFTHNGTTTLVTVNNPPLEGVGAGNRNYTEVIIAADKPAYFIQVVYPGPLRATNSAVGMCEPYFDSSMLPGLWAGSLTCPNNFNWTGSDGYIEGGIFSNNEIKVNNGTVIGPVEAHTAIDGSTHTTWDPDNPPVTGVDPQPDPLSLDINMYAPGGAVWNVVAHHTAITSGTSDPDYKEVAKTWLWKPDHGRTLRGLYYVEGNVDIGNNVNIHADGITIVATGDIQYQAGTVSYYREIMNEVRPGIRYPGLLFFSALAPDPGAKTPCGLNAISFMSGAVTATGVMYAPNAGVNVSGPNTLMRGSIVANYIDYSGSKGKFYYESSLLPPRPPSIQIAE